MADFRKVEKHLTDKGFSVKVFATGAEAAAYLDKVIDGKSVGFGGSMTLRELGLYDKLSSHNKVYWHWLGGEKERVLAMNTEVYLTSVNGLAETGELINIDGTGNRLASTLYGHDKVYFIVGRNKLAPTVDEALWRARNIAGPKNAHRLQLKTPCARNGDRCYDCKSPDRICKGMSVHWEAMMGSDSEILLVDEDLGY